MFVQLKSILQSARAHMWQKTRRIRGHLTNLALISTLHATSLLWIELKNSWERLAAVQDFLGKCPLKDRECPVSVAPSGWATACRRTQTQANTHQTDSGHFQQEGLRSLADCQLNHKAWNLQFHLQLSQPSMSTWRFVHSPHSKWTSLCFGLPKTLGGRHWPGAMLSVRAGRLSEHCRRNTGENHLLVTVNSPDLYIPGRSYPVTEHAAQRGSHGECAHLISVQKGLLSCACQAWTYTACGTGKNAYLWSQIRSHGLCILSTQLLSFKPKLERSVVRTEENTKQQLDDIFKWCYKRWNHPHTGAEEQINSVLINWVWH